MTPAERVASLSADLRTLAARWCAACADLEPLAAELAAVAGQLRAAEAQAGIYHDPRPPARELAAEVLHGAVQALAPHVPTCGPESAAQAEAQLRKSPAPTTSTACVNCVHFMSVASPGADPYADTTRCYGPACDAAEWGRRSAKLEGYVPLDAAQDCDSFAAM